MWWNKDLLKLRKYENNISNWDFQGLFTEKVKIALGWDAELVILTKTDYNKYLPFIHPVYIMRKTSIH